MMAGLEGDAAEVFRAERHRLFGSAYRLLGLASNAEDVVQGAFEKWVTANPGSAIAGLIWAAKGGSPARSAWYCNLKASPRITIEVGPETFTVLAEELSGTARAQLWVKLVAQYPQLGEVQATTARQFPVFMLTRQD